MLLQGGLSELLPDYRNMSETPGRGHKDHKESLGHLFDEELDISICTRSCQKIKPSIKVSTSRCLCKTARMCRSRDALALIAY